jgi:putative oxidoreductase
MSNASSNGKIAALWILRVILALPFLGSGGAKLAGMPVMVAIFAKIGLGQGSAF